MQESYLEACLKDGRTVRWPDKAMPIKIHIAPFRWYEKTKQRESTMYQGMVMEAMATWHQATQGKVRFQVVNNLNDSQINVVWRRVDRTSLGHCEYLVNKASMIYSAEISIGLSDNVIHSQYNDPDEVRHTILHEFGHALGLIGHSDGSNDIMYVPHQFGVTQISQRDALTVQWLYQLPVGFDFVAIGNKHQLKPPFTLQDVLDYVTGKTRKPKTEETAQPEAQSAYTTQPPAQDDVLLSQHDLLTQRAKFMMATQNIQVPKDLKAKIMEQRRQDKRP
jgi:predicted Zn-dependent protease